MKFRTVDLIIAEFARVLGYCTAHSMNFTKYTDLLLPNMILYIFSIKTSFSNRDSPAYEAKVCNKQLKLRSSEVSREIFCESKCSNVFESIASIVDREFHVVVDTKQSSHTVRLYFS